MWRIQYDHDTGTWTDDDGVWNMSGPYDGMQCDITDFELHRQPDGTIQVSAELADDLPTSGHIGRELGIDNYPGWHDHKYGFDDPEADQWARECEHYLLVKMVERYGFDYETVAGDWGINFGATATLPPAKRSADQTKEAAQTAMYDRFLTYANEADPGTYGCEYPYSGWLQEFIADHPIPPALQALRH